MLKNNLPQMDGIVSTIPLEAGISSTLFGKNQGTVESSIIHSDSEKAYSNLISGKCDIIFTSIFTDMQEREAAAKNIAVNKETVAYEGIVFIVNADNPVDTLSQEQIRDIYSGKIKNWSEVGGTDSEIITFQNNENDEAQLFMKNFMAGEELLEPKKELLPGEGSGIIETIAKYNNSENAIGYMIYKYPINMYGENSNIKFIKIDGIDPTKQNMASGEYPLRHNIYAIYNNSRTSTKTSDELAEWLLTYDGQVAVEAAGYIPIKNIKTTESNIDKYIASGTGGEKEELGNFYYTVKEQDYNVVGQDALVVGIQGLKDTELQSKINTFIRESTENLRGKEIEYEKYITLKQNCIKEGIRVETECKNGYLSIKILLTYRVGINQYIYDGYSKVYNLYTGEEMDLSDLYYNGEDFVTILNKQIETIVEKKARTDATYLREKRSFVGITNNIIYGLETIAFKKENPYFEDSVEFKLDTYFSNISVINEERDMEDIWEDNIKISKQVVTHQGEGNNLHEGELSLKESNNCVYNLFYANTSNSEVNEYINENVEKYSKDSEIRQLLQNAVDSGSELIPQNEKYQITIDVAVFGNEYVVMNIMANPKQNRVSLGTLTMNLTSGEKVPKEDLQKWKEDNGVK